jgi:hypothetical protein
MTNVEEQVLESHSKPNDEIACMSIHMPPTEEELKVVVERVVVLHQDLDEYDQCHNFI